MDTKTFFGRTRIPDLRKTATKRQTTIVFLVVLLLNPPAFAGDSAQAAVSLKPEKGEPRVRTVGTPDRDSHRTFLLTNATKWANAYPGNPFGYVPTNTVAIREYALDTLLKLANAINEKWRLGLSGPITSDQVTGLDVLPKTNGLDAGITIAKRHAFRISENKFEGYADLEYWFNAYEGKPDKFKERAKQKDLLNKTTALRIARNALHSLGYAEDQLRLPRQPEVSQVEYRDQPTSNSLRFPHYEITWKTLKKGTSGWLSRVSMQVSGITGTVVAYEISSPFVPSVPLPANYWQMLGLAPTTNARSQ
ncbi:MAG: hypothetical protein HW389_3797 [Bacteroidetes bacterium]|nr:hypothetical protein [Bacteroidota bacterium]